MAAANPSRRWRAYLLRCGDGSLYAGATNDLPARLAAHRAGRGARYTRAHGVAALAWRSSPLDKRVALSLEARIKRLARSEKLAIAAGAGRGLLRTLLSAARARATQTARRDAGGPSRSS
jgi:putative endonuclease